MRPRQRLQGHAAAGPALPAPLGDRGEVPGKKHPTLSPRCGLSTYRQHTEWERSAVSGSGQATPQETGHPSEQSQGGHPLGKTWELRREGRGRRRELAGPFPIILHFKPYSKPVVQIFIPNVQMGKLRLRGKRGTSPSRLLIKTETQGCSYCLYQALGGGGGAEQPSTLSLGNDCGEDCEGPFLSPCRGGGCVDGAEDPQGRPLPG